MRRDEVVCARFTMCLGSFYLRPWWDRYYWCFKTLFVSSRLFQDETVNNFCFFCRQCWLDCSKSIRKQMQCPPYVLYFKVKFYVSDPSKLHEEYTRLKKDHSKFFWYKKNVFSDLQVSFLFATQERHFRRPSRLPRKLGRPLRLVRRSV